MYAYLISKFKYRPDWLIDYVAINRQDQSLHVAYVTLLILHCNSILANKKTQDKLAHNPNYWGLPSWLSALINCASWPAHKVVLVTQFCLLSSNDEESHAVPWREPGFFDIVLSFNFCPCPSLNLIELYREVVRQAMKHIWQCLTIYNKCKFYDNAKLVSLSLNPDISFYLALAQLKKINNTVFFLFSKRCISLTGFCCQKW